MEQLLQQLSTILKGELYFDLTAEHQMQLMAYSTDASVYQEKPLAVAIPQNNEDIKAIIGFANIHSITIIPRAAGTSLAGQVVGNGIVVDISKHFNQMIEVNIEERWCRVQPGVIRDDLNHYLKGFGLMYGPETSTANRAMIGGMVGNNSCGLHSIVWGSARDHLLEATVILSDGSTAVLKERDQAEIASLKGLERSIYNGLFEMLNSKERQQLIQDQFPAKEVVRRNTGYALDTLLDLQPFNSAGSQFNLCKLLAGSEGTLAFITELKLNLLPLPPKEVGMVIVHCSSLVESLYANIEVLKQGPMASELVDKMIMDFTIGHPEYQKNRFFIEGDPAALLMVEFMDDSRQALDAKMKATIEALHVASLGYAYPILYNADTKYAWDIRKAGLGLLRNLRGDAQPVNLIEDCAVSTNDLPMYIEELQALLAGHGVIASYYAHAGAGELHVEPIINLKSTEGVQQFRSILKETAALVKKYNGSLSGEHGDGRLRGEFIPSMVGNEVYDLFKQVKKMFDPNGVFNAGKITNTPAMDSHFRMKQNEPINLGKTLFDFSADEGILRLAEKCSGSGDCRKSEISGGLMCPSFMATRSEKNTTRARANVLRQFLSDPNDATPYNHGEIKEAMDLCLSCKGCKIECPSSVDITKMKAEFLQQYYDANGTPFRSTLVGNFASQMKLASLFSPIYNFVFGTTFLRKIANSLVGFHPNRSMPLLGKFQLKKWHLNRSVENQKKVYFFCDEFTNFLDSSIGQKAILLLEQLGYQVVIPEHVESGRSYLSKGLLRKAAAIANQNIQLLSPLVSADMPIVGIEPSALLTLRDEYKDLASQENKTAAIQLAQNSFTFEEFIAREINAGNIHANAFTQEAKHIAIHGHCYQKVLSSQNFSKEILSLPKNYTVEIIPSGCCGMAGSFGYEKEHYDVSQKVGELILFPAVRNKASDTIVAAAGTSCRHQIKDGTQVHALHPVEILYEALV
ncbi:MAG: FAD-binding oxidoreductase [Sphingobacteriia bacterium 24-36-13]|jgi:FAD/FMN-containing dehydrogenase/Fe-S oxidoreductase|uniref:FAD-binding and (Fe-S)-binding domain-containing protein n=1 Tax=Sediminibacterium sp. TaxID=1917865 RepID=UPI000BD9D958|nr:FAD-binding and (Fe-S)-binding domain-containing protein [Sediminibacterium sp.]OYZ53946.1 MAG: FAD-binding oxidoreductase [Sphingobacteriia bacterium 24-36-13]OZA63592.1 MAG: FAD-binding oxidoreductase [Sphingobacteriia bacterium 39-36-14]HQS24880.1 FAD-linked oxidase C-terminal domain-containing protein [Sediminibacterium sp.]HQS35942.1 FAD-linked oxidase C-terminal domain-containing protein [Sediminibacterium sp.]